MAASLGKMPMTSERRLTSPLRRSSVLVLWSFVRCSRGKSIVKRARRVRPRQSGHAASEACRELLGGDLPLRMSCRSFDLI